MEEEVAVDGRSLFRRTPFEKWDDRQAVYFFGYALVCYLSYPFILKDCELIKLKTTDSGSKVKVRFPKSFHTHCPVQTFCFDRQYQMDRQDYWAKVAGPFVRSANCCRDYIDYKGISLSLTRHVRPRIGSVVFPITGLRAEYEVYESAK